MIEPNLRPDQLAWLSQRYQEDLQQHARVLEIEMPAETDLTARCRIELTGVMDGVDGTYDVESIARTYSALTGFRQHVRARQASDELTALAVSSMEF
jgi:hypothetical protein